LKLLVNQQHRDETGPLSIGEREKGMEPLEVDRMGGKGQRVSSPF